MRRTVRRLLLAYLALETVLALGAVAVAARLRSSGDPEGNDISLVAAFSGRELRSRAPAFASAELVAMYGGVYLDLRDATPTTSGAMRVRARAFRGGIAVGVPRGWRIVLHRRAIAGGVGDRTEPAEATDAPVLEIDAVAVSAGIAVGHELGPTHRLESDGEA